MYVAIPMEMLAELGYSETDWVALRQPPREKTLRRLLAVANATLDRIAGSYVDPISRAIPVQQFKNELLKERTDEDGLGTVVQAHQ